MYVTIYCNVTQQYWPPNSDSPQSMWVLRIGRIPEPLPIERC